MLPRMRYGVRRLRSGALALALAAFVPLAIPAAASASPTPAEFDNASPGPPGFNFAGPGNFVISPIWGAVVNQVHADSVVNHKTVFRVKFQLGVGINPYVDAVNQAVALTSGCRDCNAIALAFQIVTTTEADLLSVDATNVAKATNDDCTDTCDSEAEAYQLVVATDTPQALPFSGLLNWLQLGALYNIQAQFDALPQSGLDLSQIQAQCEDLVNQAMTILQDASYGPNQPSGNTPMFSPAVDGAGTNTQLTQSDRPVVTLYRDLQYKPFPAS